MPRVHVPPTKVKAEDKDELDSDGEDSEGEEGFRIRNALEPPRTGTMTTSDLHCKWRLFEQFSSKVVLPLFCTSTHPSR